MSDCKENVLEMIDEAIQISGRQMHCTCIYLVEEVGVCAYCKVRRGLRVARACIIASVGRIDVMRSNMVEMQAEIEEKLKRILEE